MTIDCKDGGSNFIPFQGEDPGAKERQKKQAQQLKDWLNQQVFEKERKKQEEQEKEK